jgi:RUN and FYVE domain-containing protein 1
MNTDSTIRTPSSVVDHTGETLLNQVNEQIDASSIMNSNSDGLNSSSPLELSFENLPNSKQVSEMEELAEKDEDSDKPKVTSTDDGDPAAEVVVDKENQPNHDSSFIKKSGSFLSKLTTSTSSASSNANGNNAKSRESHQPTASNLPSGIANLFSSVSFTSGFRSNFSNGADNDRLEQNSSKLTIETASTATSISLTTETKEQILNRKATLERKNLINLTKLIVKDLISSSLNAGRTIDDQHQCAIHLNNYFTLLDKVLKHGLKQNILTNKAASLWNALDSLPKYLADKRLTSETVRSLAHTKTPEGKIKAWLRIAMMQKKLPEYFNELLANKAELLKDIYNDYAFMMNDEAQVFAGLIIGVNVIDCNFFVKDDNFDIMDDLIDLSPYLRAANSFDEDEHQSAERNMMTGRKNSQIENLTAVLDQKNYLEERSVHLESIISSLRDKIKQLEEQNSRLEIDAKVNEVRIQKLQDGGGKIENDKLLSSLLIPDAIKSLMNSSNETKPKQSEQTTYSNSSTPTPGQSNESVETAVPPKLEETTKATESVTETSEQSKNSSQIMKESQDSEEKMRLRAKLEEFKLLVDEREKELAGLRERVAILETSYRGSLEKIRTLERDLDIQISMNNERETTIKIYEKDLREKQSLVESLRTSLNEAKRMNTDLSQKLNDATEKLKDRLNTVTNLQASLDKWKLENKSLANHLNDKQAALKSVSAQLEHAQKTMDDLKKYNERINDELRKERECGQSCSITVEEQTSKISELTGRVNALEKELEELRPYKEQMVDFKKRCQEYEQSLEEVGYQLRESRLEVESLKENSSVFLDSQWMDSKQVKSCALCQQTFSVTRRKHHCRLCGNVFCQTCSDNKMELASSAKPARVCDTCHAFLLAKFVKSSSSSASNSTASASLT